MQIHRYEYKSVHSDPNDLAKKINEEAKKGWRAISTYSEHHHTGVWALLERDRMNGRAAPNIRTRPGH